MKKKNIRHNASESLWNYTLSPGWSRGEVEVLKLALQKFGIGKWSKIIRSQCLPGKSIGQIYLQTQRIMGQQSLGDFMGLQADIEKIFIDNSRKTNVTRKNNCIINTGDNPNKHERALKIAANQVRYGLSEAELVRIRLPKKRKSRFQNIVLLDEIETPKFSTIEKIDHLTRLLKLVDYKMEILGRFGRNYFSDLDLLKPEPGRLAKKRASLGVVEGDDLVQRELEGGGVAVDLIKEGNKLKKVKGGLEGYFKRTKDRNSNATDNGVEKNGLAKGTHSKSDRANICHENGSGKNGNKPQTYKLQLHSVLNPRKLEGKENREDQRRKRLRALKKSKGEEGEWQSGRSEDELGSLGESAYGVESDPEEMMYRQYLQTGSMVKKMSKEIVIGLERVDTGGYRLKKEDGGL